VRGIVLYCPSLISFLNVGSLYVCLSGCFQILVYFHGFDLAVDFVSFLKRTNNIQSNQIKESHSTNQQQQQRQAKEKHEKE
jgi:hypothetical protein